MSARAASDPGEILPLAGPSVRVEGHTSPGVATQLALALWRSRGRVQGVIHRARQASLAPIVVERGGLTLDPLRIARFRRVCVDRGSADAVPAAYLETLFIGPMASIVLHPSFPLSPLGLVHLRQRLQQRRWVRPDERLELRCALEALRRTPRGYEADCAMLLSSSGEPVWQGLATLLSRDVRTRERGDGQRLPLERDAAPTPPLALFDAAADVGRRYAAASGDYNPHHLFAWSARLVGFRRPIAHGIWTLARCLAELGATATDAATLQVEAQFKRPVFLPGRVALRATPLDDGGPHALAFSAAHPERDEPHVVGQVRW